MKKLFDSGELGRAESKHSRTNKEDDLALPLFWPTRTRESRPANANNSVFATENPWRSWVFWAEPRSARIFSSHDSETSQQSAPHIQLELMRRQPPQGNADRVLVEHNFDTTSVTWRSKFSAVLLLHLLCASAQLKPFSGTQTWTLFKLSDQGWISFVW